MASKASGGMEYTKSIALERGVFVLLIPWKASHKVLGQLKQGVRQVLQKRREHWASGHSRVKVALS